MSILNFTLNPEALNKLHDALSCLGKFSEAVSIEASHDKFVLTALNSSKSAYASFTFIGDQFFSKYQYRPLRAAGHQPKEKFNCKIYNKALLSVFRGRVLDPTRERDTAVERCDVSIEDGDGKSKSRFIVKIICRHGVVKTYRLTFESVLPMHALFVKESANNSWSISSRTLREFVEHFGSGTERLDIYSEDGRVNLTSYTEKIMAGNEILKQPLHTSIAIDSQEFSDFAVEEKLHIVISVKDFKSIITHAGITNTAVKALYSRPSSPMQLTYSDEGVLSEFILMTIGESRGGSVTPAPNAARANSKRPASRQTLEPTPSSKRVSNRPDMPPPTVLAKDKVARPSPPPPQPSIQSQALFFPEGDDDRRWDPVNYDDEEDEMLLWDAGPENNTQTMNSGRRLQGTEAKSQSINSLARISPQSSPEGSLVPTQRLVPTQKLAPTQRLSGIRGMFDD